MTLSRNTKFRENALYFREITKLVSLPFRENFAKRNSVKNPSDHRLDSIPLPLDLAGLSALVEAVALAFSLSVSLSSPGCARMAASYCYPSPDRWTGSVFLQHEAPLTVTDLLSRKSGGSLSSVGSIRTLFRQKKVISRVFQQLVYPLCATEYFLFIVKTVKIFHMCICGEITGRRTNQNHPRPPHPTFLQ
jgi:hypothetical protein